MSQAKSVGGEGGGHPPSNLKCIIDRTREVINYAALQEEGPPWIISPPPLIVG